MRRIFVSSIQRDYSEIRQAVAAAIQALGFEPLMAETAAASPRSPRGALLGLVREADAVTLIIGPRYGAPAEGGLSPTEEEFNEAVASGKPVIVLVHDTARERAQEDFLVRVRGRWGEGRLSASFSDEHDVGMKLVAALRSLEQDLAATTRRPLAEEKATKLAVGEDHGGYHSRGGPARVALVPLVEGRLVDDPALNDGRLADQLTQIAEPAVSSLTNWGSSPRSAVRPVFGCSPALSTLRMRSRSRLIVTARSAFRHRYRAAACFPMR